MARQQHFRFGAFRLYPSEQLLLRDDRSSVPLAPKAFDLLLTLVKSGGHLLTREELMKAVWPESFVEETNLTVNISLLRKVLGELANGQPYIETVPRKGYRFKADVTEVNDAAAVNPVSAQSDSGAAVPAALSPGTPELEPSSALPQPPASRANALPVRIALAVLIIFLAAAAYLGFSKRKSPNAVSASVRSMAILPFRALDPGTEDAYLGLGLTDALITRLGGLRQVIVRPIGAVRKYTAADDPLSAGKQLSVESVMEGSIQRMGDRTRVTARLLRVADGEVLWSGTFDERISDMFATEDSISQKVVNALTLDLTGDEKRRLAQRSTASGEAYQLYLKGRVAWAKRTVDGVKQSIDYLQRAVQADPNYALAYSGLADSYLLAGSYGYTIMPPSQAMPLAKAAAQRALSLDQMLGEAHTSLAYVEFTYDWDWTGAEQEFKRAIMLNPDYANAHHWYSHELTALGRSSESMLEAKRALELSPSEAVMNEHMGWTNLMSRDYPGAIQNCQRALSFDPDFLLAHRVLALAYEYQSRYPDAIAEFQKGVDLSKDDPVARAFLARSYAASGQRDKAMQIVNDLEHLSQTEYVSPAEIAAVYATFGDADETFRWLDKAYQDRTSSLIYLKVDPAYDKVRTLPQFGDLLRRMNLQ